VTLRYTVLDVDDVVVAEQWWTTVFLGVTCNPAGDPAPEHVNPDDARVRPIGTHTVDVDTDMARRYAEVSGDWSAHHFEIAAARVSGFDRLFLHGLCTMALCAHVVHVRLYDAGVLGYAFEADSAGATVVTHGRAELR
jgi:acyl dehydratase